MSAFQDYAKSLPELGDSLSSSSSWLGTMASGGGNGGSSSLKTVVLNSEEMIEEVDVITMAAGRSLSVEHLNLEGEGHGMEGRWGYAVVNKYSETN